MSRISVKHFALPHCLLALYLLFCPAVRFGPGLVCVELHSLPPFATRVALDASVAAGREEEQVGVCNRGVTESRLP